MIKHKIFNQDTGRVLFTAEIDCDESASLDEKDREAVLWAIENGKSLSLAALSFADLSWIDLSGVDLSWANLEEADLSYANLNRANLFWTNLSGANLFRAKMSDVKLSEKQKAEAIL